MAAPQLLVRRAEFGDADVLTDLIGDQMVIVQARFGDVDIPWLMYLETAKTAAHSFAANSAYCVFQSVV